MPKRTLPNQSKNIMDYLVQTDIESQIRSSQTIGADEKNHFLHLLSYFTPRELDELRLLL